MITRKMEKLKRDLARDGRPEKGHEGSAAVIRPIVQVPDPVLRAVAEPVAAFDDGLRDLARDMLETMYEAPGGRGLAAPQGGAFGAALRHGRGLEGRGAGPAGLREPGDRRGL
jgi:hypothetical protein